MNLEVLDNTLLIDLTVKQFVVVIILYGAAIWAGIITANALFDSMKKGVKKIYGRTKYNA